MGKWINFVLAKQGEKTNVWQVKTKDNFDILGEIKWFSRWRRYAFFPYSVTIYEQDCLRDIANFIEEQMNCRKQGAAGPSK